MRIVFLAVSVFVALALLKRGERLIGISVLGLALLLERSDLNVVVVFLGALALGLSVGLQQIRKIWWSIRGKFTDRRIPMPYDVRRRAWARWGRRCAYCGQRAEHLDHVKPYWWLEKNGRELHTVGNLRPACAECNLLAGGRVFDSFEEKKAWIRKHRGLLSEVPLWRRLLGGSLTSNFWGNMR